MSKSPKRLAHYNLDDLALAVEKLRSEDFLVTQVPVELLTHGTILAAWNEKRSDGFLIATDEIGLVARQGLIALDPFSDEQPRWNRKDQHNRYKKYAEAVLAKASLEISVAKEGSRNQTLSRYAFTLGRLLYDSAWGINESEVTEILGEAASSCGLSEREARSTINSSLEAGKTRPKSIGELEDKRPNENKVKSSEYDAFLKRKSQRLKQ